LLAWGEFIPAARRTEKTILRKREIVALLKMANQALSLDSWSHWTLIRPLESSSPRESIMPLNDAKNPQLTLQA